MKAIIYELRMWICELVLGLLLKLAPKKDDGKILIGTIHEYFNKILNGKN